MDLFRITLYVNGSKKFKMAAVKTEMLISQLLDKIATKFQRLPTLSVSNSSAAVLPILHDVTGSL